MKIRKLLLILVPMLLAALALYLLLPRDDVPAPDGPPVICLDPGHGGSAAGAVNGERMEKDDNLRLALRVRELLEERGEELTVLMTRADDTALELQERTDFALQKGATMFVSFHRNSGGGAGVETWTAAEPTDGDTALADAIQTRLVDVAAASDRGVRKGTAADPKGNYFVLSHTLEIPSCLIELGFIDSADDNALFDQHFEAYAAAIADGILKAAGLR